MLLRSPALAEDISVRQRTMASPIAESRAGNEPMLVRTGLPCQVIQPLEGSYFLIGDVRREAGLLSDTARWIYGQKAFTPAQCVARFCHHPPGEIDALLKDLVRLGALAEHPIRH